VIVINTSFRIAPWADVLYACDASWWKHYFGEALRLFQGQQYWTIAATARDQYKLRWILGNSNRSGLSRSNDWIVAGKNSGYQAIGLAAFFGCSRILLLGYDFQRTGGKVHWHPDHPRGLGNGGRFQAWVSEMSALAQDCVEDGIEVINCSRVTALQCFPRKPIQECLP
jgi:hypothetical protein